MDWRRDFLYGMEGSNANFFLQVMLEKGNKQLEFEVVKHLDIQPDHHVLEVGFGPGVGLSAALKKVENGSGKVHGIDISEQMVSIEQS